MERRRAGEGSATIKFAMDDANFNLQSGKSAAEVVHDNLVVANAFLAATRLLEKAG